MLPVVTENHMTLLVLHKSHYASAEGGDERYAL